MVVALASVWGISSPASGADFIGLGDLPGGIVNGGASGVSGDGSVVVGNSFSAPSAPLFEAFRWTSGGGIVGLGDLPGGVFESSALGVSGDGSVIVGASYSASGFEAFRWTAGGGMVGLGDFPGGTFVSAAWAASGDGTVVVGAATVASGQEAFRWTSGGGMVGLGDLPGGIFSSGAFGVSDDGSVVVGESKSASGNQAFRWTSGGGMVGLGVLPGGLGSLAFDVSGDGSFVVGVSGTASGIEAFRWTSGGGMVGLGDLPGGIFQSEAWGVSGDGSVVVGDSISVSGLEAYIWDSTNGLRNLRHVLINDLGLDLTGWTLLTARAISDDGLTVVGRGWNPSGSMEAWRAELTPPPPPVCGNGVVEIGEQCDDGNNVDDDGCSAACLAEQLGHFTFYKVKPTPGAAKLRKFGPVRLTDQLGQGNYLVRRAFALGLPADKNGEGVDDPITHLMEYKIARHRPTTQVTPISGVRVLNQCNDILVTVKKPISLLLPTHKDLAQSAQPVDPLAHNLDHFLCYKAKAEEPFPKRIQVDVVDQFQERRYELKRIKKLCVPVAKEEDPLNPPVVLAAGPDKGTPVTITPAQIRNPTDHLVCYRATRARRFVDQAGCGPVDPLDLGTPIVPRQPPHQKRIGMFLDNQFGAEQVDTKKEIEFCIPSEKFLPGP